MKSRTRARATITLATAAATVVLAGQATAQTAARPELIETGWWSDALGATSADGGTTVGASPDGGASVSAFRIQAGNGLTNAYLDLTETSSNGATIGGVSACIAPNTWRAVEQGPIDDAPRTDCDDTDTVPVARDDANENWSVDLTSILVGATGEVTVVFVPDIDQDATGLAGVVPWSVSWAAEPVFAYGEVVQRTTTTTTQAAASTSVPPGNDGITARPMAPATTRPASSTRPTTTTTLAILADVPTTTSPPTTVAVSADFASAIAGDGDGGGRPIAQALFFLFVSGLTGITAGTGRWLVARRSAD